MLIDFKSWFTALQLTLPYHFENLTNFETFIFQCCIAYRITKYIYYRSSWGMRQWKYLNFIKRIALNENHIEMNVAWFRCSYKKKLELKYSPLNRIMVNGIIRLMGSNWPRYKKSQISLNSIHCIRSIFGYCYHLVNGISYSLAQSNPFKRQPLYVTNSGSIKKELDKCFNCKILSELHFILIKTKPN